MHLNFVPFDEKVLLVFHICFLSPWLCKFNFWIVILSIFVVNICANLLPKICFCSRLCSISSSGNVFRDISATRIKRFSLAFLRIFKKNTFLLYILILIGIYVHALVSRLWRVQNSLNLSSSWTQDWYR